MRVQGRSQLNCGFVDIDGMIIQINDFWGEGVEMGARWGYRTRKGVGRKFR